MGLNQNVLRRILLLGTVRTAVDALHGPSPFFTDVDDPRNSTHFAAFSILDETATVGSLTATLGPVEKPDANPLFRGTEIWEHSIDNGYPTVLFDPLNSTGQGIYRVYYNAVDDGFPPAPGCPPEECGSGSAVLYATSDDGLVWKKPDLHRFTYANSTANNIIFPATSSLGIYDDGFHERNLSRRFKIWGNLGTDYNGGEGRRRLYSTVGGSAVSTDGVHLTDYRELQAKSDVDPDTWRFDCQTSLFYDPRQSAYSGTMRAYRPCDGLCGSCSIWWQPSGGCLDQISDTCTAEQCNATVRAIGLSTTIENSDDFATATWGPNVEVQANHTNPERQFYSQVTFPFFNVYLGILMILDAADPPNTFNKSKVHCELSFSHDAVNWQRIEPGREFIPLGSVEDKAWDSHVCFAAAFPVKEASEIRLYYMGGDGPHYSPPYPDPLHRNTSFGFATLRPDGFVALRAADGSRGVGRTVPLLVTGSQLILSADTAGSAAGSVSVQVFSSSVAGGILVCDAIVDENVTDAALGVCDQLESLVGESVVVEFNVTGAAAIYTIGFRQ